MRCRILHESSGRMRVHFMQRRMTPDQADLLQAYLEAQNMIVRVRTDERTCNAVIWYRAGDRPGVVKLLASFGYDEARGLVCRQEEGVLKHHIQLPLGRPARGQARQHSLYRTCPEIPV